MGNQNFKPNVKVQFIKGAAVNMYTFSFYVAMKKYTSLWRHPLLSIIKYFLDIIISGWAILGSNDKVYKFAAGTL